MTDHAIVESPLQFITAVEALQDSPDALIHWRDDATGMTAFMASYRPEWLPAGVRTQAGLPDRTIEPDGRLLLGDLCSGRIQMQLADAYLMRHLPHVVILDDGLSTVAVVRQLMLGRQPVRRPRESVSPLRLPLSAFVSSRLRGLARKGRLEWFTALVTEPSMRERVEASGLAVTTHRFEYTRALPAAEAPATTTLVIGSSMVADGLVDERPYMAWVRAAAEDAPVTYYPHRREDPRLLAQLANNPRISVEEPGLPLELRLSVLPAGTRILSLPSTAVLSLALINPTAEVVVTAVPASWWLPAAPRAFSTGAQEFARQLDGRSHGGSA